MNASNSFSDVDECEKGTHGCHGNATCANVAGSYSCPCVDGFSGDGLRCDGEIGLHSHYNVAALYPS